MRREFQHTTVVRLWIDGPKHREYKCFQLLLSSSVALDLAAAVDRWQQKLANTSVF